MPAPNHSADDRALHLWQALADADGLPPAWLADAVQYVAPLANRLAERHATQPQPLVVGINGAQGTGKSTLAKALALMLETRFSLKTTALSLDDFYLGHAARQHLSQTVHPLLATRGVPGTHDIALALATVQSLRSSHGIVALPAFDKASDDCVAESARRHTSAPRDVIILEGWCIGVRPQTDAALTEAVNTLETQEDTDGRWRHYVNDCLAADYQALFANIDYLVMLKAPDFDCVLEWRSLQETKLADRLKAQNHDGTRIMSADAIARFIQHYERLTRHGFATLPERADTTFYLDTNHRICDQNHRAYQ